MKKSRLNRKAIFLGISVIAIGLVIALSSFFNAGIDPNYWKSSEFISDLIITASIGVFGIIAGQGEGDNYYKTNENGLFVKTYNRYNEIREKINPIVDKFTQWNEDLYKREYFQKCIRFLKNEKGIKQAELVIQLDRTQVSELTEAKMFKIDGVERYFNSLTKDQIKAVYRVLDGRIKVQFIHESYYLNAYTKNKTKSMYEQASDQEHDKRVKFFGLMSYRIIFTALIGLVLTGLKIDINNEVVVVQAIINLFSRLFTLFSSICWGFFIANDMIKDECSFLDYKKTTLETFYLDVEVNKTFIVKTEEEKAMEKVLKLNKEKKGEQNDG